jgi:PAS domain S-box-containing protein
MSGAPDGELQARLAALKAENAGLRAELAAANVRAVEQKRAEAALAESEGRLRALTSNFPAGAIYQMTASPDGERRFLYVSESVENFGGLTAAELMADATLAYRQLEPEFLPQVIAAEAASMRDHSVFDEEVRFRRRDGQLRWARIVSRPRPQPDGGWVWDGLQFDITEQKEAEQRLRELNATLEERVAARAAELAEAHDALRQSQKLESMGQLTGGVAHDFNNLLSPIIGGLDLLQRSGVGDARAQRMISGALQSAERARILVQRLLAFARRQPLQVRPVDLGALVQGMRGLLESSLGPRIRLALAEAPGPVAQGDTHQLELALLNLALNARDAMPSGGVLTVTAGSRDGVAVLGVSDTGHGMDAETLARAVEPFFSTKGLGEGTGLGLSMVHGLAAQLGGELRIESAPGEGTRAFLHLPLAREGPADVAGANEPAASRHAGLVLLVDDEELVRASTADLLDDLGYQVIQAASADAALDRLREGAGPDILVTDHLMPGMTGAELAEAARALRPDLPILIVTGYAESGGIAADLPRLAKPFRREELAAALDAVLARAPA